MKKAQTYSKRKEPGPDKRGKTSFEKEGEGNFSAGNSDQGFEGILGCVGGEKVRTVHASIREKTAALKDKGPAEEGGR